MGRQWGRLYSGARHHPKIRILRARLPKCWKAVYPLMEMSFEADDEGRIQIAPGQPYTLKELAKEVGESVKNLQKIIQILVDLGMISYQNNVPQFLSWNQRQFGSDIGSAERTRKWRSKKSASQEGHGDVTDTGKKEKEKEKHIKPPISPPEGDVNFLRFWEAYPNRAGGQEKAWRKWKLRARNKNLPPIDYLIEAIEKLKRSPKWNEDGGAYIPMITTFLNQGRWTDADALKEPAKSKKPEADKKCPHCLGTGLEPADESGLTYKTCRCVK